MDIIEAIRSRRSIRAFKPNPVSRETLESILNAAILAPSWANTQPWEFTVVGGKVMEELRQALLQGSEEAGPELGSPDFTGAYDTRRRDLARIIYETKGIARDDREERREWALQGRRLFDAPNAIIVYFDRSLLLTYATYDCACVAMNIMLAALHYGLGTIPQIAPLRYPQVVKRVIGIPDTKVLVITIAIGYPDLSDQINEFPREREPAANLTCWVGF